MLNEQNYCALEGVKHQQHHDSYKLYYTYKYTVWHSAVFPAAILCHLASVNGAVCINGPADRLLA